MRYDYIVTEVSGSEATGWTGRGELNMNFLKIGTSPVIEIPLAVKFENMHLNQCYQILPGSKVITEFDPYWGTGTSYLNPENTDEDRISLFQTEELIANNTEIVNILEAFDCSSKQINDLNSTLSKNTELLLFIQSNNEFSQVQKDQLTANNTALATKINSLISCCGSSGARLGSTSDDACQSPSLIIEQINSINSFALQTGKDPANKSCGPTNRGNSYPDLFNNTWKIIFTQGNWAHKLIQADYLGSAEKVHHLTSQF